MAKLVGISRGVPVQAAAGDWQQQLASPLGAIIASGVVVGGWMVGSAVGHSIQTGAPILEVEPSGVAPTDFEEWLSSVVAFGLLGASVNLTKQIFEAYGTKQVLGYSAAYIAFMLGIKLVRDS